MPKAELAPRLPQCVPAAQAALAAQNWRQVPVTPLESGMHSVPGAQTALGPHAWPAGTLPAGPQ
jgi:hypothetical protein